jgi:hypothetical protein
MISTAVRSLRLRTTWLALAVIAVMGIAAGPAQAAGSFGGHLPPKTWTTNGIYDGSLYQIVGEKTSGAGAFCIGPAQYSGTWKFPYGWDCENKTLKIFEFPVLGGYAAADNPNSAEIGFGVTYYG